jgi:tRNA dimethylallyltransferase
MNSLVAIVGPTASGKSDLSMYLAEQFNGEIVSYDSVQIYRHLDIGTAKPTREERARVPHHMIDIREPNETYSAGDYQRDGREVLGEISARGRLPVLVGGTGLYLRALTEGLFSGPRRSEPVRSRLEAISERKGREYLHRILQRLDAESASRIMPRDKPKVIRAIEVRLETGKALTEHWSQKARDPLTGYRMVFVGLNPDRDELYTRIDERVVRMFKAGLVNEVRELLEQGLPRTARVLEAIGYRPVLSYLDSCSRRDETIRIIQRDTRRYAKRQLTWFRRQSSVKWFSGPGDVDEIKRMVHQFVTQELERNF